MGRWVANPCGPAPGAGYAAFQIPPGVAALVFRRIGKTPCLVRGAWPWLMWTQAPAVPCDGNVGARQKLG